MDFPFQPLGMVLGWVVRAEFSIGHIRPGEFRSGLLFGWFSLLLTMIPIINFAHPGAFTGDEANLTDAEVQRLEERLQRRPDNADAAAQLAHHFLDQHARHADNDWLNKTRHVLEFWSDRDDTPPPVLRELARYHQRVHNFTESLTFLNRLVRSLPTDVQAQLDKSSALTTMGRYPEALAANQQLRRLKADLFVVIVDRCAILSRSGQAEKSFKALDLAFNRLPPDKPGIAAWAHGIQAETADRIGQSQKARAHLHEALRQNPGDPYLLLALARIMQRDGEHQAVLALLPADSRHEGIRLQRILAMDPKGSNHAQRTELIAQLDVDFKKGHPSASPETNDAHPHLREEAIFAFHVLKDRERAYRCATANWKMQREPEDLEILTEVLAAHPLDQHVEQRAALHEWLRQTAFERRKHSLRQ